MIFTCAHTLAFSICQVFGLSHFRMLFSPFDIDVIIISFFAFLRLPSPFFFIVSQKIFLYLFAALLHRTPSFRGMPLSHLLLLIIFKYNVDASLFTDSPCDRLCASCTFSENNRLKHSLCAHDVCTKRAFPIHTAHDG